MAGLSAVASAIGAIAAVGGGIANNVAQNRARAQARHALGEQMKQAEIDRAARQREMQAGLDEQARIHRENMERADITLAQNRDAMNAQIAQAQQGLQMQSAAMVQQKADADRQFAMQQAQTERSMNMAADKNLATFKRPDGVAGTILTGPGGVDKNKLKKGGTTLLGGV